LTKNLPVEIKKDIYFVGVFDKDIRTFDIIMKTANGSSYNSYLIKTEDGVIILDTVKKEFQDEFFEKIEQLCSYDEIKYIVLNHLEPDHSGAVNSLLKKAPNAKVLISARAKMMLKALAKKDKFDFQVVKHDEVLTLGGKTFRFLSTPYLHWPETMSTYLEEDKMLFSGDVFGSHYYDDRIFDDLVGDFDYAFQYYYNHIMGPFKSYVLDALKIYNTLDIDVIAPLHGPIIRHNPAKYMSLYHAWSSNQKYEAVTHGKKVVSIFYLTSYKNTREMAEKMYEGADTVDGIIANVYDLASIEDGNMLRILEESDAVLIGTPTINGDAPKPVWDLLSNMMLVEKKAKTGGAFGSFGWSGEAPNMIIDRMKSLKFRTPVKPLRIKLIPTEEELEECFNYGREFAEITNGKKIEINM
jgi:flavorubredoxin